MSWIPSTHASCSSPRRRGWSARSARRTLIRSMAEPAGQVDADNVATRSTYPDKLDEGLRRRTSAAQLATIEASQGVGLAAERVQLIPFKDDKQIQDGGRDWRSRPTSRADDRDGRRDAPSTSEEEGATSKTRRLMARWTRMESPRSASSGRNKRSGGGGNNCTRSPKARGPAGVARPMLGFSCGSGVRVVTPARARRRRAQRARSRRALPAVGRARQRAPLMIRGFA